MMRGGIEDNRQPASAKSLTPVGTACEERPMISEPEPSAKTVHLIPDDAAIKRLCFDETTQSLRPNLVLVDRQGAVVFEINELGLKGAARDPERKLAVVWGDSVVFGVRWSWPCLIDELAPGWQFLNGGIEGDPYRNILRRAADFNRAHELALNVLMLGWQPWHLPASLAEPNSGATGPLRRFGGLFRIRRSSRAAASETENQAESINQQVRADLLEFLEGTPNTVLATMPTALNPTIVDQDLSSHFRRGDRDTVFSFAGDLPYSVEAQHRMFAHIAERNAIVRTAARDTGVRVIDLAAEFDTEGRANFREDFHDMLHLRPRAYPKAAAAVYEGIKDLL
jgi:lysophospholipase L1-like esterase